jgi:hypothetical protein
MSAETMTISQYQAAKEVLEKQGLRVTIDGGRFVVAGKFETAAELLAFATGSDFAREAAQKTTIAKATALLGDRKERELKWSDLDFDVAELRSARVKLELMKNGIAVRTDSKNEVVYLIRIS